MTQRGLIKGLNSKIHGFGAYHRIEDASDAFRHFDVIISSFLLKLMQKQYPKWTKEHLINKFWYEDENSHKVFALTNRKDIRLFSMADIVLIKHRPLKLSKNPYLDYKYFEEKLETQDIDNINGKYRAIWRRQNGKCYYCGQPILPYQEKKLIHKNSLNDDSAKNMAYIHKICEDDEIFFIHAKIESPDNIDVFNIISEIGENDRKLKLSQNTYIEPKYYLLSEYFRKNSKKKFSLSFSQIEKMLGFKLCKAAYKQSEFWYNKSVNSIPYSWKALGYEISQIEFKNQKVYFHKIKESTSKLTIPKAILDENIPNEAKFELEKFFSYIIKKYGL